MRDVYPVFECCDKERWCEIPFPLRWEEFHLIRGPDSNHLISRHEVPPVQMLLWELCANCRADPREHINGQYFLGSTRWKPDLYASAQTPITTLEYLRSQE